MKKPVMLLAMVLVSTASARAQEPQVGRYQMIAVPASQSQTFPETLLLDTASGQTWILYHETGQSIEWLPLRYWGGKDRPRDPLAAIARRGRRLALVEAAVGAKWRRGRELPAAQCAAGARPPPSLTFRRLIASGTAASESSISTQNTST